MQKNMAVGLAGLALLILGFVCLVFVPYTVGAPRASSTMSYDRELFYLTPGQSGALVMGFPPYGPGSTFEGAKEVEVAITEGPVGVNYTVVVNGSATQVATTQEVKTFNVTLVNGGKTDQMMISTVGGLGPTCVFFNWPLGWNKIDNIQITNPTDGSAVVSTTAFIIFGTSNGPNQTLYAGGVALTLVGIALATVSLYIKRSSSGSGT